ncbi:thymus-specific serine protease [Rhineura floridana]|uniref:thymus-specific serine protease n=1 Tax=Rhineura floridana TaxID=261503 RepID=UPI002AC7F2A5|nr:thymus-specific serine protease [Rhineura floridana]
MGSSSRVSWGILFLQLLALAEAGRNFWLIRQHVLKQREERAMQEVYDHLQQLLQGPAPLMWNPPIADTIRQPLDHFNREDPRTYNQRFWINEQFWQRPSGPIFLFIGGESSLSSLDVLSGHHVELAEMYGALLVALEHRFYGASINPDGLQDHNLQFLSSQQALSDLATFNHFVTQKFSLTSNNTWICFGGSYPGSLSAWFRLKFPHLVFAAVASSAPVKAQLDFTGYLMVVAASLSNPVVGGSKECLEAVAEAFAAVDNLVRAGNLTELAKDFHSCWDLEGVDDCAELVSNLADIFMAAVQYNNEYLKWSTVANFCDIMTNHRTGSAYQRLIVANNVFLDGMKETCTMNCHSKALEELRNASISPSGVGLRQWFFQTCTEFGYYQTCDNPACSFSHLMNLTFQVEVCQEVFNISSHAVQEAVSFTNDYYGADHPKASRVLFVNGDIDPWHALSVLKNQSSSELAILINGTAHCADMSSSSSTDPLPLVHAKEQIASQIGEWLKLARKINQDS